MGEIKSFFGGEADSHEPSRPDAVRVDGSGKDRRPGPPGASPEEEARHEEPPRKKRGRPANRWRIRVIRIDAAKYVLFQRDREHPFLALPAQSRIEEIDSFVARLWARAQKSGTYGQGRVRKAA